MLAKVKNSKHSSSISKASGLLAGSSMLSAEEWAAAHTSPELTYGHMTAEIQAAQKLLAQIAVRLLNIKRKEEEK